MNYGNVILVNVAEMMTGRQTVYCYYNETAAGNGLVNNKLAMTYTSATLS